MSVLRQEEGRSGIRILQMEVGLGQNMNEIIAGSDGRAAIVDPAYEVDRLLREASAHSMNIEAVLVTHTHHDHIDGVFDVVRLTGARVYVGRGELEAVKKAVDKAIPHPNIIPLDGGEAIDFGELHIQTIPTPGHTVAGISYAFDGCVCTGDTLFVGGCGRTDFPGGDPHILWASLQRLASLPEETRVYPGHDYGATPTSTIAHELHTNPYLKCADKAAFVALRTGKNPPKNTRGQR
jgi:glyoxylase-like metal-dependent hydrolase (beta-lactamase superfamily II)